MYTLYGISIIYGCFGTLNFNDISILVKLSAFIIYLMFLL